MQRGFRAVTKVNNTAVARRTEDNHENISHEFDVLVGNRKRPNKQAVQIVSGSILLARCVSVNITNQLLF